MHEILFKKGDIVFAQCGNFKPWPAKITKQVCVDVFLVEFLV